MANFLDLELSDYVLSHVDENDDESPLGIIEDTLVFSKKKVNPFCIIFAEDIKYIHAMLWSNQGIKWIIAR